MPGRAELDLIVGLISKVKDGLPSLKVDVEKAAQIVNEALKAPTTVGAGKAFAEMFDINGKSVTDQIKIIEGALTIFQEKLRDPAFREMFAGAGAQLDTVATGFKALGNSAVESLGSMSGEISRTQKNIAELEKQLATAKKQLATAEPGTGAFASAQEQINKLETSLKRQQESLAQSIKNNVNNFRLGAEQMAAIQAEADAKALIEVKAKLEAELAATKNAQSLKLKEVEAVEAKIAELKGQKGVAPGVIQGLKAELTALKEQGNQKVAEVEAIQAKLNTIAKGGVESRLLIEQESTAGIIRSLNRELEIRTQAQNKSNGQLLGLRKKYLEEAANLEKQVGTTDANEELLRKEIAAARQKAEVLLSITKENNAARALAKKQGLDADLIVEASQQQKIIDIQQKLGVEVVKIAKQVQEEVAQVKSQGTAAASQAAGEKEVAVAKEVGAQLVAVEKTTQEEINSARAMYSKRFSGESYKNVLDAAKKAGAEEVAVAKNTASEITNITKVTAEEKAALQGTYALAVKKANEEVVQVVAKGQQEEVAAVKTGGEEKVNVEAQTQAKITSEVKQGTEARVQLQQEEITASSLKGNTAAEDEARTQQKKTGEAKKGADARVDVAKGEALSEQQIAEGLTSFLNEQDKMRARDMAAEEQKKVAAAKVTANELIAAQKAVVAAGKEAAISVAQAQKEADAQVAQAAKSGSTARAEAALKAGRVMVESAAETEKAYTAAFNAIGKVSQETFNKMIQQAEASAAKTKTALDNTWKGVGGKVSEATLQTESALQKMSYGLMNVGFQLSMFGAAALEAFKAPLEAAKALDKVIKYTATISQEGAEAMKKAGGDTKAVYEDLRQAAKQMSMDTAFSAEQAAKGLQTLVQAGYTAAESIRLLPDVLSFAQAGMTDVDTAVKILVSTMTTFNEPASRAAAVMNTIAAGANTTSADVTTFGNALKFVGPLANQLGMELNETVTVLGAFHQAGIRGSMAGTSFTNILRVMLNPTAKARTEMEKLGVSLKDSTGQMKPFGQLIDEFKEALDRTYGSINKVDQAAALNRIFGVRGGPGFTALVQQGSKGLEELNKAMETQADNQKIAAEMSESLWGQLEKLGNAWTNLKESIGSAAGGGTIFGHLVKDVTELVNAISKAIDKSPYLQKLVSGLMSLAAVTGGIAALGGAITLFGSMMTMAMSVMGPLGRAMGLLTTATEATGVAIAGAGKAATVATPAFSSFLAVAGKLVLALAAIKGAWDIGNAIYQFVKAFDDANEQIDEGTKRYEKFKEALEKPIKTQKEFEILSEEEKRKEIQRLSQIQQAYIGKIQELEVAIQKKEFFGFLAPGDEKEMKQKLAEMKRAYNDTLKAEGYYKLHVYTDAQKNEDLNKVEEATSAIDEILGNKAKGIKGIDGYLAKQIKAIDDSIGKYEQLGVSMEKASSAGADGLNKVIDSQEKVALSAEETAAKEIDSNQRVVDAKVQTVDTFFNFYMDKLVEAEGEDEKSNEKLLEAKQKLYDESSAALQTMYDQAIEKQNKYVEDVIKSEEELSKKRVEIHEALQKSLGVDDSVKNNLQKYQEMTDKMKQLDADLIKARNEGNVASQKKIADEILKTQVEANKAASKYAADLVKEKAKLTEDIAKSEAALATKREQRARDANDKQKALDASLAQGIDAISDRRQRADDRHAANLERLKADLAAAELQAQNDSGKTASKKAAETERVRRLTAQVAAEDQKYQREIAALADDVGDKRVAIEEKVAAAKEKGASDTAAMDAEEDKLAKMKERLDGINTVINGSTSDIIKQTVEVAKQNEEWKKNPAAELAESQKLLNGLVEKTSETEQTILEVYKNAVEVKKELARQQGLIVEGLGQEQQKLKEAGEANGAIGEKGKKSVQGLLDKIRETAKAAAVKMGIMADTSKADKAIADLNKGLEKPIVAKVDAKLTPSGDKEMKRVEEPKGGTAVVAVEADARSHDWAKELGIELDSQGNIKTQTQTVKVDVKGAANAKQEFEDVLNEVNKINEKVQETFDPNNIPVDAWVKLRDIQKNLALEVDSIHRSLKQQGTTQAHMQQAWLDIESAEKKARAEVEAVTTEVLKTQAAASELKNRLLNLKPKDNNITYKVRVEGEDKVRNLAIRLNEIPGIIERLKQQGVDFNFKPAENGILEVKQKFLDTLVEMRTEGEKAMIGKQVAEGVISDYKESSDRIVTTITGPIAEATSQTRRLLSEEGSQIWANWKKTAAGAQDEVSEGFAAGSDAARAFNAETKQLAEKLAAEKKAISDKVVAESAAADKAIKDSSVAAAIERSKAVNAEMERSFNDASLYNRISDSIANLLFGPTFTEKATTLSKDAGVKAVEGIKAGFDAGVVEQGPWGVPEAEGSYYEDQGKNAVTGIKTGYDQAVEETGPWGVPVAEGSTYEDEGKAVLTSLKTGFDDGAEETGPWGTPLAEGSYYEEKGADAGKTAAEATVKKYDETLNEGYSRSVAWDKVNADITANAKTNISSLKSEFSGFFAWLSAEFAKSAAKAAAARSQAASANKSGGGRYGGLVAFAQGMREGGAVQKLAAGGHLSGYGGGDRIPALLEAGEYVLPKEAVRGIGVTTLNALRAMFVKGLGLPAYNVTVPRMMAAGGPVAAAGAGASSPDVNLNLNFGGQKFPLRGQKSVVDQLTAALRRESLTTR